MFEISLLKSFFPLALLVLVGFTSFATPRPTGGPPERPFGPPVTQGQAGSSTPAEGLQGHVSPLYDWPLYSPASATFAARLPAPVPQTPVRQPSPSHWRQQGFGPHGTQGTHVLPGFAAFAAIPPMDGRPAPAFGWPRNQGEAGPSNLAGGLHGQVPPPLYNWPQPYSQIPTLPGHVPTPPLPQSASIGQELAQYTTYGTRVMRLGDPPAHQIPHVDNYMGPSGMASYTFGTQPTAQAVRTLPLQTGPHDVPSSSRVPPPAPGRTESLHVVPVGPTKKTGLIPVVPEEQVPESLKSWLSEMQRALGNPELQFFVADGKKNLLSSRVFVAQHGTDQRDHLLFTGIQDLSALEGTGDSHFIPWLRSVRKLKLTSKLLGDISGRTYVYLNSRYNMHYLNEHYFENRLHFLPLNPDKLDWTSLNTLLMHARTLVLPPKEGYGFPLLVRAHLPNSDQMGLVEQLTGGWVGDRKNVISLWSPVLHRSDRATIALYGIAQIDMRNSRDFHDRFRLEAEKYGLVPGTVIYHVDHDFPPQMFKNLQDEIARFKNFR